jgi:hypothetical protein
VNAVVMEVYVDPLTGGEYVVDPSTGQSHWITRPSGPAMQQTQELPVIGVVRGRRPGLPGPVARPARPARQGRPGRPGRALPRVLGGLVTVAVLVAGLVVLLSSRGTGSPAAPSSASGRGAGQVGAGPVVPGIGSAVRDGKFEFTITSQRTTKKLGNDLVNISTKGKFLLLSVTVRNISDQSKTFVSIAQKLHDTHGDEYTANARATLYLGEVKNLFDSIGPGGSVRGTLVFELPPGASPERVELHDSLLSNGTDVRLR